MDEMTLLKVLSRFGDKSAKYSVACTHNGAALLKGSRTCQIGKLLGQMASRPNLLLEINHPAFAQCFHNIPIDVFE